MPGFLWGSLPGSNSGEQDRGGNVASKILNILTLAATFLQEKHARNYLLKTISRLSIFFY